ncbi:TPA: hypothetical protein ACH3X1_001835 [Trebouxia sp. C0004]
MMDDPRPVASTIKTSWGIALIAFLARLTSFAISQIANNSAADYDTSAGLQRLDCCSADTVSVPLADSWSQSKAVWDSVFFTRIALCGYEYEQFYAFFPLLPGLMNVGMKSGGLTSLCCYTKTHSLLVTILLQCKASSKDCCLMLPWHQQLHV